MFTDPPARSEPLKRSAFISHSSRDNHYVSEHVNYLRTLGYEIFNDDDSIPAGAEFWPQIEQGIRQCDFLLVIASADSAVSEWVQKEVEFGRELGKTVIGLRIDDHPLPSWLDGYDVVDLRPGRGDRQKIAPSRILRHAPSQLFGREEWLDQLDAAWAKHGKLHVFSLIAWGGVGKTSIVARWVAERMVARGWEGVDRYFDWSFYDQGTKEQSQASADFFIAAALEFFGDPDPQQGSPWERGERLARLVARQRTLLILDGVEPLQYPPTSPQAGEFKDQALEALLQGLAIDNRGLCVVTSREPLAMLKVFVPIGTAAEERVNQLRRDAALALLRRLQIVGTDAELEQAWKAAGGHALTLSLLGRFIAEAYPDRDIRHYEQVKFTDTEEDRQGRSAFKVMLAYETWLRAGDDSRHRQLAILRLTGLFDRPISTGCLAALRAEPAIPGLTEPLVGLKETQWNRAVSRLKEIELVTVSDDGLDAHPLVREYFAEQLRRESPAAFQAAHSRLFDHLCETTEHQPDTLAGLQPLYQAVAHGCVAGRHEEARADVYIDRILRGTGSDGFYSLTQLGAIGADLGAVAAFFEEPWSRLSPNLSRADQAWLLNEAGFGLRALGRLTESLEPTRVSGEMDEAEGEWEGAAVSASNLSQLEVTLGRLSEAVADGRRGIDFADRSGDAFQRMSNRATVADALHQAGQREAARTLFAEAERLQAERQPEYPLLYSLAGFQYIDLLLAPAERAAWQTLHTRHGRDASATREACQEPTRRANWMFETRGPTDPLLDIALGHLTLARAALYGALLTGAVPDTLAPSVATAHSILRQASQLDDLPKALLTAALHAGTVGEQPDEARRFLDEAELIARRGPMPLYLADVHLHRARLFRDKNEQSAARALIETHGYHRRDEELADAEEAAKAW